MGRLWRSSLVAGSLTGAATSALVLAMFFFYDELVLLWPVAFVPVFLTGVIALRRAGSAVRSPRDAALAGAIAGITASLISSAVILMEGLWAQNNAEFGPINASAYWTLL